MCTVTVGQVNGYELFYELFLSLEPWGYFGPLAIVISGYYVAKREGYLGVLWFVFEALLATHYYALLATTPGYYWHFYILILGGIFTCVLSLLDLR